MKKCLKYLKPFKKQLILGPIFKLIEAIFELIVPMIMALVIDKGLISDANGNIVGGNEKYILTMGAIILGLGILGLASSLTCQFFASRASQGYGTLLRNELFTHINNLSFQELDKVGSANLITIMTTDIDQLQTAVAMFIRLVIRAPFLVIGSLVMAFIINVKVAIIFVIMIPIIGLILWLIMKKSAKRYPVVQKELDEISKVTSENLTGARVIKSFVKQETEINRFNKESKFYHDESIKIAKITSWLNPLTFACINLAILAVLYFGGIQVKVGSLTQGNVIALVNYLNQILLALIVVSNLVVIFTKAKASLDRCNNLFSLETSIVDSNNKLVEFDSNKPLFEFKNVSFKYPNSDNEAISNISFTIDNNSTVGLIGGTGAGKSTIIQLLERFYDVSKGEILFHGINIKNISINELRNHISQVFQKSTLFKGTIRSNLTMKNKEATDKDIYNALDLACASDFVNKYDDKIDHLVEEDGKNFSGGQRQRLCIARAILSPCELLILDDSTSALDYLTDLKVRQNIKKLKRPLSVLISSQRASTIKDANSIIVVDSGTIVGIGTHTELLNNCPIYQEIYNSQTKEENK